MPQFVLALFFEQTRKFDRSTAGIKQALKYNLIRFYDCFEDSFCKCGHFNFSRYEHKE
jgi:hypothetical protein